MENAELIIKLTPLILLTFSLVFTLGIIWRVEMRLDTAYKIFFGALLFLLAGKIADIFVGSYLVLWIRYILDLLFSVFLLWGIWLMRDLMRDIDKEKE